MIVCLKVERGSGGPAAPFKAMHAVNAQQSVADRYDDWRRCLLLVHLRRIPVAEGEALVPFVWADGPLVQAMLQGDIILIDELNLAEDAVLERLNR